MTQTEKLIIHISGMSCNHCKMAVEKALSSVKGVTSVTVELEEGTAHLEGENLDTGLLQSAIEEAGYSVEG